MENRDEVYNQLKNVASKTRYNKKDKFERASKGKLSKVAEQKLKTTMIGAIARFEKFFGEIWGHSLPKEQRSQEQNEEFETWQKCRDEILNLGNSQFRALLSEFELYNIEWRDSSVSFIPRQDFRNFNQPGLSDLREM